MDTSSDDADNGGRPRKPLHELKDRALRYRLAPITNYLTSICIEEGVELDYLVSLIAMKHCLTPGPSFNYAKGKIFEKIVHGKDPFQNNAMSPMQGLYLQEAMQLGKLKLTSLKSFLQPFVLPG